VSGSGAGALIEIAVSCPDPEDDPASIEFDVVYIDPSGTILTVDGEPVAGATVTLLRSDFETGPFATVPDGSTIMSPANRTNPYVTGVDGKYQWDVITGFYKVVVSKPGCHKPGDPFTETVTSAVLTIPPPVTGLDLVLDCPVAPNTVSIGDVTVWEGDDGTTQYAQFPVVLGTPSATEVTVLWSTGGGDAVPGADYLPTTAPKLVRFRVARTGVTPVQKFVTVRLPGNSTVDGDRKFNVILSNPIGYEIGDGIGIGTIRDNDPSGGTTVSVGDISVHEGDEGKLYAKVPVTLSSPVLNQSVELMWSTSNGTAFGGTKLSTGYDYQSRTARRLIFRPGQVRKVISVAIQTDNNDEVSEIFSIALASVTGASLADATGLVRIVDDD
jgi:hypothetical protein